MLSDAEWESKYRSKIHWIGKLLLAVMEFAAPAHRAALESSKWWPNVDFYRYVSVMEDVGTVLDREAPSFSLETIEDSLEKAVAAMGFGNDVERIHVIRTADPGQIETGRAYPWPPRNLADPVHAFVQVNLCRNSIASYRKYFHEYGHALHYVNIDRSRPFANRLEVSPIISEPLAEVIEMVVVGDRWLQNHTQLPSSDRRSIVEGLRKFELLRFYRESAFAVLDFIAHGPDPVGAFAELPDIMLYINKRYLHLNESFGDGGFTDRKGQLMNIPIQVWQWPISLLIREHIRADIGDPLRVATADKLRRYFAPGGASDWAETLRLGGGRELDLRHGVRYLMGAV